MLSVLRPVVARQAGRSLARQSSRAYSAPAPPRSTPRLTPAAARAFRTAGWLTVGLAIGGLVAGESVRTEGAEREVRTSVLDQDSLKAPIHKPGAGDDKTAGGAPGAGVVEKKNAEASSTQGAFNEETGEINWDCPCLGGMADGPCGEQFKAAFSCFVFSEAEPKGMDCVEKFKLMQDCFREHPDIYGEEIDDEEGGANADSATASPTQPSQDGGRPVPPPPKSEPPANSPVTAVSPEATPSKGSTKIKPSYH